MTTRSLFAVAAAVFLGCNGGAEGSTDVANIPVLVPLGAQVTVQVGGTWFFTSDNPEGGEPLGLCDIQFLEFVLSGEGPLLVAGAELVLANFQRALPRGSDDFFSIQIQDEFVSWGLFDKGTEQEWSNRPDGQLSGSCSQSEGGVLRCTVLWRGEATDDCTSSEDCTMAEVREATVEMLCAFGPVLPCTLSCGDGNSCTVNFCLEGECQSIDADEGSWCEFGPGIEGECTAAAECLEMQP